MGTTPFLKGATIAVAITFGFSAAAEVTYSTANNPTVVLDEELDAAFGSKAGQNAAPIATGLDEMIWGEAGKALALAEMMTPEYVAAMETPETGSDEWACLTEALYFEARGEKLDGIFAVAEVILNRVADVRYPDSICGVVHQGTGEKWMCQFSYYCDGEPERVTEPRAWAKVAKIAQIMIETDERVLTDGATHYHTKAVDPYWADLFPRTTTIGYHHFYREPSRLASASG